MKKSKEKPSNELLRLNKRVQHRGWKWLGTVVDFPFDATHLSYIMVLRDEKDKPEEHWLPSLMAAKEEAEEFDWDE